MRQAEEWEIVGSLDWCCTFRNRVRAVVEACGVVFVENTWDTLPGPADCAIVLLDDGSPFAIDAETSAHHDFVNVAGRIHSASPAELCRRFMDELGLVEDDLVQVLPDWTGLFGPESEFRAYPPGRTTPERRAKRRALDTLEARYGVLQPEMITLPSGKRVPVDGTDPGRTVLVMCLTGADDPVELTARLDADPRLVLLPVEEPAG
jgi:hypothetical protein